MALIKSVVTQYGIEAEYHKIINMNIDWYARMAALRVGVFLNKLARFDRARPIVTADYFYNENEFPFTVDGNNLQEGYLALKATELYAGALDDL